MGGVVTVLKRSVHSFGSDRCASLAAGIAYYTVFALFPMALVGVALLGLFVDDASARASVVSGIAGVITLGDAGEEALNGALSGVSRASGVLGLFGILTALWSASGLFGSFRAALDSVWDVDRPLPMLRGKLRDIGLLIGFGGLLGASTTSTAFIQGARQTGTDLIGPLLDLAGPLFALVAFFAPLALTFAAFMILYRMAPHARLRWRDVWPSALIAALFFEFGKNALTYYISNLGNFNALAGSLGAAILFLVFVYYSAQVVLFAAEVAKHRLLIQSGVVPAKDEPATPKPKVSLVDKVQGTLKRLWQVDESHHDKELPYAPARLDPATNQPTNTREEVLFAIEEGRKRAQEDAGEATPADARTSAGAVAGALPASALLTNGQAPMVGSLWWRVGSLAFAIVLALIGTRLRQSER